MKKHIGITLFAAFTILTCGASSANSYDVIDFQKITFVEQSDSCNHLKTVVVNGDSADSFAANAMHIQVLQKDSFPTDSIQHLKKIQKKKKVVAAILAFPFPFGFVGSHRVLLGTKPWVPVVYVATFGGCFGLLPLIDFCVIIFHKDIEQYENNPNIFMWLKD